MRAGKKRALGALVGMTLASGLVALVAALASAASCGWYAGEYPNHTKAETTVNMNDLCGSPVIRAKYYVSGSSYTYTSYGPTAAVWPEVDKWYAKSPAVPSGKNVAGSTTKLLYYGNWNYWYKSH